MPVSTPPPSYPVSQRPHSTVATYVRDDLQVTRLQAAVTRDGHRLRAQIHLSVTNHGGAARERVLRVGRCVRGGRTAAPICPATASLRVRIAPGATATLARTVIVRQPSPRPDQIQVALVKASTTQPYAYARSNAFLLLKGQAWRGPNAGIRFGVDIPHGSPISRVFVDAVGETTDRLRLFARYDAPDAALAGLHATLLRCVGGDCTPTALGAQRDYAGPGHFGARPDLARDAAERLAVDAASAGGAVRLDTSLPWPR